MCAGCSERLAQVQLAVEDDPNMTFAPAINDHSVRLAVSRELRQVGGQAHLPLPDRLTSRHPPKLTPGPPP